MTQREFFQNVVNANITEEMTTYAEGRIAMLDKENERRRTTLNATQQENVVIMDKIYETLSADKGTVYTAQQVGVACNISTAKASSLCAKLVEQERLTKSEVKIKGKGKVNGYAVNA